jgi:RND family efflux transporter MFP subunit
VDALLHAALNNAGWAAALALVAAVGGRIWRRRPAVVHALWLMVLLKLVTPSLVQFSLPRGDGQPRDHAGGAEPSDASRPNVAALSPVAIEPAVAEVRKNLPSRADAERTFEISPDEAIASQGIHWSWRQAILAVWLTGTTAWWLAVSLSAARFRRLIRSARPAPPELVERLGQVAARLELRRAPSAWLLPARVPPMLWVPFAGPPRLVLPEELWGHLDAAQQDAVLAHELAHLKRRDHWVRRLEAAVLGLYWWDPVAWWARREVERSEEECCDAWVVWALPRAADAYAEALVATATYLSGHRRSLPMGASGVGSLVSLKRRLAMIVCDSVKPSVVRTAPRALLVLGILTLPFLPGLAAGKPASESARARAGEASSDVSALVADPAQESPAEVAQDPKPASDSQQQAENKTKRDPKKVQVFQPISREVGDYVDINEPAQLSSLHMDLHARVSGRVDQVYCRPGQSVTKGQLLFGMDQVPYKIAMDKAQAGVRQAQARQKRCKSDWDRAKLLVERKAISQEECDRIETEYEEAAAALEAAEADRQLAEHNLDATKVVSPIDGVISRVQAGHGDFSNNSTNLATIVSLDPLYVEFYIDEALARFLDRSRGGGRLKAGTSPEIPILIGVKDEVGLPHAGKVDFLDPQVQPVKEAAVHLRATVPNRDGSLAPGLRARIRLVTNSLHKALLIPERLVGFDTMEQREYVYVLDGRDVVQKRLVRLGVRYDDSREVEEGLKSDDWVVMAPRIGAGSLQGVGVGQRVVPERMEPPVGPQ